jgi:hypothetical protein
MELSMEKKNAILVWAATLLVLAILVLLPNLRLMLIVLSFVVMGKLMMVKNATLVRAATLQLALAVPVLLPLLLLL